MFSAAAMDRYTPGEAYAFTTYELKKKQQQQLQQQQQAYLPPTKTKQAQQTRPVPPRTYSKLYTIKIGFRI